MMLRSELYTSEFFKANNRLIEDGYSRLFINILICNASPSLYIFSVLAAAVPVVIAI